MNWSEYLDAHQQRFVDELVDFVRIPSVSALAAHIPDVVTAGNWVMDRMKAEGLYAKWVEKWIPADIRPFYTDAFTKPKPTAR